jgi:hypothetical protein
MLHHAAATCAVLEKPAQAVTLLRKAARIGLPNYPLFRDEPHFRPLQNYAPFLRLMTVLRKEWTGYRKEFGTSSSVLGNRE